MTRTSTISAPTEPQLRPYAIERVIAGTEPVLFEGYSSHDVATLVIGYHVAGVCKSDSVEVVERWVEDGRKWFRFSDGTVRGYRVVGPDAEDQDDTEAVESTGATVAQLAREFDCKPHEVAAFAGLSAEYADNDPLPLDAEALIRAVRALGDTT